MVGDVDIARCHPREFPVIEGPDISRVSRTPSTVRSLLTVHLNGIQRNKLYPTVLDDESSHKETSPATPTRFANAAESPPRILAA